MTRKHPFEELEQFFERMTQQVDTGDWTSLMGDAVPIDLVDTGDTYELSADLPGFDRDDIDITISGDSLQLDAVRESETTEDIEGRYIRRERQERSLSRSIRIPDAIDHDTARAKYTNGVLSVTLPKSEPDEEGRQIDIE